MDSLVQVVAETASHARGMASTTGRIQISQPRLLSISSWVAASTTQDAVADDKRLSDSRAYASGQGEAVWLADW